MVTANPFIDAFEPALLRLLATGALGRRHGSLALTAIGRGEGVSTLGLGLAAALARRGQRVLLVDGTPLGRRCGALLGLRGEVPQAPPQALEQADLAAQAGMTAVAALGIDLLSLGDAPQRLDGDAARPAAWRALCADYDCVLVDAGCLRTDTPYRWRAWVDHMALVLDTTLATVEAVQAQRRSLAASGLALAGFILNKRAYPVPGPLYRALN